MRTALSVSAIALAAVLSLSGCVDNSTPEENAGGSSAPAVEVDAAAAALLPDDIASAGVIIVGMDPNYAPNEYKNDAGDPIGWEVDLGDAVAAKLGVKMDYRPSGFDKIIPSITGESYDIGISSFTDNPEREQIVDFVNYYNAGIQWAQPVGKSVDPANACGLTVAVQATTYEETEELPAKSQACTDQGLEAINILKFETQDEATNALALGRADAMSADSPITQYAVSKVDDKIELAGEAFDVAPYGIAVAKNSELTAAIQAALQSLVDDGTYTEILAEWGVEAGGVDEITLNAGAGS
ncbi:MAG: transporter substrate-binding protein [Microbacteriaceae bacterium]|jgi:polar amino acid transport system substrate-binding protein|nr:transporter substrate-binding protein [Microbacteriaceae bacterium]